MAKKKSARRAYLDSFTLTPDGKYEYSGDYRVLDCSDPKRELTVYLLLALVCAVSTVICGCLPAPGMRNTFYVILPTVGAIISALSLLYADVKIGFKGKLRSYTYRETVEAIPLRSVLTASFSALSAICEILCIILDGTEGQPVWAVLFVFLNLLSIAASVIMKKKVASISWEIKNS